MNFPEIITDNCANHSEIAWWPEFAFHYTNITNAINILRTGYLYSRVKASEQNLMKSDNASKQVINMTNSKTTEFVRFYFRPMTPTQYHNEGFKHSQLRYDGDTNANVPVPIFFLFNLRKLLEMPGTQFSQNPQSGYGSSLYTGASNFAKLDFDKIYGNGPMSNPSEDKRFRHAEIVYPGSFDISSCLQFIVCRNNIEKITLLNCIKDVSIKLFEKYSPIVKVPTKEVFYKNGLFITDCAYNNRICSVVFSDTYAKYSYMNYQMSKLSVNELRKLNVQVSFDWVNKRDHVYQEVVDFYIDYANPINITLTDLPLFPRATNIKIKVFINKKLMCYIEQPLVSDSVY